MVVEVVGYWGVVNVVAVVRVFVRVVILLLLEFYIEVYAVSWW